MEITVRVWLEGRVSYLLLLEQLAFQCGFLQFLLSFLTCFPPRYLRTLGLLNFNGRFLTLLFRMDLHSGLAVMAERSS